MSKQTFLEAATKKFGAEATFKNQELISWAEGKKFPKADWNWLFVPDYKVGRGEYKLPKTIADVAEKTPRVNSVQSEDLRANMQQTTATAPKAHGPKFDPNAESEFDHAQVPEKNSFYVPFGEFNDVGAIIKTGEFFPVFISGLSGNGKTFMVEQACARAKRPMVRVQMSRETDEDDLIGGFRLIQGETKFMKGPVLRAMELGALLLIDEADRADAGKIMCLQGVLEGKPYYVKKTGEVIKPAPGFNVIVTANTKGKGSEDGRYVAAGVLDDAWLERFPITIEQGFPSNAVETRILKGYMSQDREMKPEHATFIQHLIAWADVIRKSFAEGAIDELVSTRRLVHIVQTFRMFNNKMRAINLCINRFDSETKAAFLELYSKVDPDVAPPAPTADSVASTTWEGTE